MLTEPLTGHDVPWKQRYRLPRVYGGQVAALDFSRGLASSNKSGIYQLYAWDVPTGDLTQLTHRAEGVSHGTLSPDGNYVYYHDDNKGNEVGHTVRVPFEGGQAEDITPDLPLYEVAGFSFSHTGNMLGFTTITEDGFDVYCVDVSNTATIGTRKKLAHYDSLTTGPIVSYNGEFAVVIVADRPGSLQFSLIAFDIASGEQIARLSDDDGSIECLAFSPVQGDMRVVGTTDCSGVKRPLLWNVRMGERVDIALPELEGEVEPLDWSQDGENLLLCQYVQAVEHLHLYNLSKKALTALQHPEGTFSSLYFVPNGNIFAQFTNSIRPTQLLELDGQTGEEKRVVLAAGTPPASRVWTSVTYPSSNGDTVQAWLATPEGTGGTGGTGPFPTILEMHGGPEAATMESYSPNSQSWLDHGFAFLSINYHGSTTFGREFQEKIRGHIGYWELEDMVAAREWLVQHDIAIPTQIFLTGWSYGGYLTLYGLGKRPDLWAGGLAGVAFGDYVIAYEDEAEMLKAYDRGLMGGTPTEKPEEYKASSPITYVEQVKAPVLIIQGSNDTRCPPRSVQVYEEKMKQLGKNIEVFWFDAGHGSLDVEKQIDHQERMLRFAYQTLRQQKQ